jgi:SAM-dependent methyltransferase
VSVFGSYARYYDRLYKDKDYGREADFVTQLLQEYAPKAQSLLELGCGTGRHAEYLIGKGYQVTGVERSPEMLSICRQRHTELLPEQQEALVIFEGDLRTLQLNAQFDVVLALFHVVNYQTTQGDLRATFQTVHNHLKPGGIFLFDIWYGPGVLSDLPAPRIKRISGEDFSITRFAQPTLFPNENSVDVHYQIYIQDHQSNQCEFLEETHKIRYLFYPELAGFCQEYGLKLVESGEWLSRKPLGLDTWSGYLVAKCVG